MFLGQRRRTGCADARWRGPAPASRHPARRRTPCRRCRVDDPDAGDLTVQNCMCVWPQTTRSASTPANDGATRSSGVLEEDVRVVLGRRVAERTRPTPSTSSSSARATHAGTDLLLGQLVAHPADHVRRGRPCSLGSSSRSALPRIQRTRSPETGAAQLPRRDMDPRPRHRPRRLPHRPEGLPAPPAPEGYRARRRAPQPPCVGDLEHRPPVAARPGSPGEDAQRGARASAAADDHPAVAFRNVQPQQELALGPVELLDPHGVGLGHEPLCEIEDEAAGTSS